MSDLDADLDLAPDLRSRRGILPVRRGYDARMARPGARSLLFALAVLAACGTRKPVERPPAPVAIVQPSPEVLLDEGRQLRAEGDLAGARARLEAAHAAAPSLEDVRLELAELLVSDGAEPERAAALLGGVAARGPRFHLAEAALEEIRGDDAAAEAAYGRALAEQPDPDVRVRRALLLDRLGRAQEALAELELVRAERPGDAFAGLRRAELYEVARRLEEAEAELLALAEAQPERPQGWERLARFYERTGRPADARSALGRARDASGGERVLRPLLPSRR
jgi:thioredoxin-like negative regulator of GroEL